MAFCLTISLPASLGGNELVFDPGQEARSRMLYESRPDLWDTCGLEERALLIVDRLLAWAYTVYAEFQRLPPGSAASEEAFKLAQSMEAFAYHVCPRSHVALEVACNIVDLAQWKAENKTT